MNGPGELIQTVKEIGMVIGYLILFGISGLIAIGTIEYVGRWIQKDEQEPFLVEEINKESGL